MVVSKSKRSTLTGGAPIHDFIIAEILQCPVCAEKDYILIHLEGFYDYTIVCLSCCYDGSMSEFFEWIGGM